MGSALIEPQKGEQQQKREVRINPPFRQVDGDVLFLVNRNHGVELFVGTGPRFDDGAIRLECY
jgi:hypothetical protein